MNDVATFYFPVGSMVLLAVLILFDPWDRVERFFRRRR